MAQRDAALRLGGITIFDMAQALASYVSEIDGRDHASCAGLELFERS
jgi:hypothetical protein